MQTKNVFLGIQCGCSKNNEWNSLLLLLSDSNLSRLKYKRTEKKTLDRPLTRAHAHTPNRKSLTTGTLMFQYLFNVYLCAALSFFQAFLFINILQFLVPLPLRLVQNSRFCSRLNRDVRYSIEKKIHTEKTEIEKKKCKQNNERDKIKFSVYKLYYRVGLTDYIIFTQRALVYIQKYKKRTWKNGAGWNKKWKKLLIMHSKQKIDERQKKMYIKAEGRRNS